VVEILLQRTRAEVVAAFVPDFLDRFPDWDSIVAAPLAELVAALAPLGLHRRRAAALRDLASSVQGDPPASGTWQGRPGVGQYVARAIAVNVENRRCAMVDTNFVRVLRRLFGGRWASDYRYDKRLQTLAVAVVEGAADIRAVNWAVLDLGATVCKPRRPNCKGCPLQVDCRYATEAEASEGGDRWE